VGRRPIAVTAAIVAWWVALAALAVGGSPVAVSAGGGPLVRLNQMQVIGSHNSYHVEPPPDVLDFYLSVDPSAIELAYTHAPLPLQFADQGVRQIELDIRTDPAGDLFRPFGDTGFKVLHIEQIDEGSTCLTLVECLRNVRGWSDANPLHMPIAILLEIKDQPEFPGPPDPLPMTAADYDALDAEVRSVFTEDRILTPDDVRGSAPTLEEAVLTDGWPAIDDVRGQVMFLLDNKRDDYVVGHPTLEGRAAFTPSTPGQPDAAFVKRNDPTGVNQAEIRALVEAGYVVRTRADSPVVTPQSGDTTQREAALASGAQWVSTDYPVPGMAARWGSDYFAAIPGGTPARCNPVNAPPTCTSAAIEDLPQPPAPSPPAPPATAAPTTATSAPAAAAAAVPRFTG
jgi:hypothetical protein